MQTRLPFDAPEVTPRHTGVTGRKRPLRVLSIFRGPFGLMIVESDTCVSYAEGRPVPWRERERAAHRDLTMWTWDGSPANDAPRSRGAYGPHPGPHPDAR